MVYGSTRKHSREADIVLWDAVNYPSLPMLDHSFYFAESVRVVIESKSRWSQEDFNDVLSKCKAIRDIVALPHPALDDSLALMQLELSALREGRSHDGMLHVSPHIGTAAVFLTGGTEVFREASVIDHDVVENADDQWPDLLLLLGAGRLVIKDYSETGNGTLLFFSLKEDTLLAFTNALLKLLLDRSVLTESAFYLWQYADEVLSIPPYAKLKFPLTRLVPGRKALWRDE